YEIMKLLAQARNEQGLSQAELAQRCGLKQSNISRLETGSSSPTLKTLEQLASGLGRKLEIRFV
ncbi:MAG: helix-turn-helix transcriptional regulator, partial [Raoultibacter sp.]